MNPLHKTVTVVSVIKSLVLHFHWLLFDTTSRNRIPTGTLISDPLHKAILTLSKEEQWLIHEVYFENQTEREVAKQMSVYHNAVHKQKKRILEKLKKILEKN